MKVCWTPEAEQDRDDIWNYIARDSSLADIRMDQLFSDLVAKLADIPHIGHIGDIPGTRELIPHESYRLVYEVEEETMWILALMSTAGQCPPTKK